jgi:hypothetical protein
LLRCLDGIKEKRCSKKLVKRFVQLMLVDIWRFQGIYEWP